jgi:hypothetical protein
MSTQAVSNNSLLQELQSIRQDFQPGRAASPTQAQQSSQGQSPAFVVTINAAQASSNTQPSQSLAIQQDFYHQRAADLKQLGQALTSGDADAAQQAYDALTALGANSTRRNGQTFRRSDRAQDFTAIGQALTSGDLAGAETAFAALSSTFGHVGPSPLGPPIPAPSPQIGPTGPPDFAPPVPSANAPTAGNPEVVINVGASNAGSQIQIDLQGQSGGGEAISINFNGGNNNSQLVLNLFQGPSASVAPQSQGSLSVQA